MQHVYLTEEKIVEALQNRAITQREAEELQDVLRRCRNIANRFQRYAMAS